ncbi:hypothetical protein [Tepidiforma bonchosmolovskayae]|uniref:Uncharacterized protein n=1 Tax=Tepidiforma bonchosmolovskayae TaxID=2601677 RepID=A0ABX6C2J4_9CHLR|nr:hypothetical protein [Tepidiforma bonchosmolovskayae]QFG02661.1 hypothetical protein Tbon_04925 [Tepidiforma bonchosmolovskayae]
MNATDDRETTIPAGRDAEFTGLIRCKRCNLSYTPSKSTSALRLTYCSFLCELGDLGFSMQGLEHMERVKKTDEQPKETVRAGTE